MARSWKRQTAAQDSTWGWSWQSSFWICKHLLTGQKLQIESNGKMNTSTCMQILGSVVAQGPEARTRSYHLPAQEASVPKKSYGLNIFWQVLFVLVKKSKQWKTVSNACINKNIPKVLWCLSSFIAGEALFELYFEKCSLTKSGWYDVKTR